MVVSAWRRVRRPDIDERLAKLHGATHVLTLFCDGCGLHKDRCRCEKPDLHPNSPHREKAEEVKGC